MALLAEVFQSVVELLLEPRKVKLLIVPGFRADNKMTSF